MAACKASVCMTESVNYNPVAKCIWLAPISHSFYSRAAIMLPSTEKYGVRAPYMHVILVISTWSDKRSNRCMREHEAPSDALLCSHTDMSVQRFNEVCIIIISIVIP